MNAQAGKSWQSLATGLLRRRLATSSDRRERRPARSGGNLFRHHQRRDLGEPQRRRKLDLHRAPPAAGLRGGGRGTPAVRVLIPTPLRSYTGERHEVQAMGANLAAILADLDRRYPGIRFRMIDEQDAIRRHIRIFVNGDEVRRLQTPLRAADEILIVQALSGG